MENKLLYRPRSRTFRGYLLSYTGVVLIALALLGILTAWQTAARMQQEALRVTQNKLYTVTGDLESQFADMRGMALEIASAEEFSTAYFSENKYREVELLAKLKKYKAGPAVDFFFLKYKGYDNIFASSGTTLPFGLYLQQYLSGEQIEELEGLIEELHFGTQEKVVLYKAEGAPAFFLFPLQQYAVGSRGEGVLCFAVSEQGLERQMNRAVGRIDGELAVYYNDTLIYGKEQKGESLERVSDDGRIRAVYRQSEKLYFSWENLFSVREWLVLGGITLALLTLAFLAAWRSYRPILELTRKYKTSVGDSMTNDLDSIDLLLDTLFRREENSSKRLKEQYQLIREQTVRLIARGGYSRKIGERLSMLNLHLDTAVFCRMQCDLSRLENVEEQMPGLCRDIEDLSEEGEWIYPFIGEQGILKVLAALDEEYQVEEVQEAVGALLEARGISATVTVVEVCHDIRELNQSKGSDSLQKLDSLQNHVPGGEEYQEAGEEDSLPEILTEAQTLPAKDANSDEVQSGAAEGTGKRSGRKNTTAAAAVRYITENCTKYDLSLDMVADEFNITPTYLCRIIKQQMGVSYKEYLTQLRMEAAKKMLQEENASIADVCLRTGYTNVSHFIKVFQKAEGVTPAKYRDEMFGK